MDAPEVAAATTAPEATTAPAEATPLPADPLLARLDKAGTLPFTAGAWVRRAWRDGIHLEFTGPVKARATKITTASGTYAIVIR